MANSAFDSPPPRRIRRLFQQREFGLALLVVFVGGLVTLVDPSFLSWVNVRDILVRSAPTMIVACGVMLVVVTGEIDISVGSLMGFLAAILGMTLSSQHFDLPILVGVFVTMAAGLAMGLLTLGSRETS